MIILIGVLKDIIWVITAIVIPIVTFLIGRMKRDKIQSEALKILLQNALTNQYFVYEKEKEMYDYQYRNWLNMLAIYEALGGDEYIHELAERMKNFRIIKTDILK